MWKRDARKFSAVFFIAICGILMAILLASAASAGVIDLVNSFPISQGQNGFNAYGFNGTTYRSLEKLNDYVFYTSDTGQSLLPVVERVATPALKILMYPSLNGPKWGTEWAVLNYSVAATGFVDLNGAFADASSGKTNTKVLIYKNDDWTHPLFSDYVQSGHTSAWFSVSHVSLTAGDNLRFAVATNAPSTNNMTSLKGTIAPVVVTAPEPATFASLAMGFVGLLAIRRRK